MGKRKRIGIYFTYNENWIGGTYYIINIVEALKLQPKDQMPELHFITHSQKEIDLLKNINYPFGKYVNLNEKPSLFLRAVNKLTFYKFRLTERRKERRLDLMFPYHFQPIFAKIQNGLNWIPDFQEKYLPDFFSKGEISARKKYYDRIADDEQYVVFSSLNALGDFDTFYPAAQTSKFVLNFAVTHPKYDDLDISHLKDKYSITKKYFFSPNQFWIHKNHIVVLKAIKSLKDKEKLSFQVFFSGKEHDYRSPDYFESLKQFVEDNSLQEDVRFLGFIDRNEQLQLMNYAEAIIQPSLFEGWSTVVEDAKAMNQCIIASNLAVHKEQLKDQAYFFDPHDEEELSTILLRTLNDEKIRYIDDYEKARFKFGETFLQIVNEIC